MNYSGIYIHATDTCYGFGCRFDDTAAIKRVQAIKGRDISKPFSLLFSDFKMLEEFCFINNKQKDFIENQKAPSSFILRKKETLHSYFPNLKTVSIRLENNKFPTKLSSMLQCPTLTTSVNISGEKPLYNSKDIKKLFLESSDDIHFIDSGNIEEIPPSTIWDLTRDQYKIIR